MVGGESRVAYDRVSLSMYLYGLQAQDLTLVDESVHEDAAVDLRVSTVVSHIDRERHRVETTCGDSFAYDAVVLATGSRPFVPPVDGNELDGCFVYRTFEDLDAIRAASVGAGSGVVLGGGLLGLEAASALRALGLQVHVVERAPWLMPEQLDERGGHLLSRLVSELGVGVRCGVSVDSIADTGQGWVSSVELSDGSVLGADILIFATGIRPRDELARNAGLDIAERGGVLADSACRTSDDKIWAIGECAAINGRCFGLVEPGYAMAESVVAQLLGTESEVNALDTSTKLKLLGVEVACFGDPHRRHEADREVVEASPEGGAYGKVVVRDGVLLGGVLVGNTVAYRRLHPLVGQELPAEPESLLRGNPGNSTVCADSR